MFCRSLPLLTRREPDDIQGSKVRVQRGHPRSVAFRRFVCMATAALEKKKAGDRQGEEVVKKDKGREGWEEKGSWREEEEVERGRGGGARKVWRRKE